MAPSVLNHQWRACMLLLVWLSSVFVNAQIDNSGMARPLTANHPAYPRARSLLTLGLPLYLRYLDRTVGVDVESTATAKDLYNIAAQTFGIDPEKMGSFELSLGGTTLKNDDTPLADSALGFSAEAFIEVVYVRSNDLTDLMHLLQPQTPYYDEEGLRVWHELKEWKEAEPDIVGVESQLFKWQLWLNIDVTVFPTDKSRIKELKVRDVHRELSWQYLPKRITTLEVTIAKNDMDSLDFVGLVCEDLESLTITAQWYTRGRWSSLGWIAKLKHLDLSAIARCRKLKSLEVTRFPELQELDLAPLRELRELETLKVRDNGLLDLDVEPLRETRSLRAVDVSRNRIPGDKVDAIRRALQPLKDRLAAEGEELNIFDAWQS